jgi:hypothetical protein
MKKIFFLMLIISMFLNCDELEKNFNYIEVTVTGIAQVVVFDTEKNTMYMDKPVAGEPVEMKLVKAGGERVEETGITGADGKTSITAKFNLYKEQPIEFVGKPVNYPEQVASVNLTWEEVDKTAFGNGMGEPRTASRELILTFGKPITN